METTTSSGFSGTCSEQIRGQSQNSPGSREVQEHASHLPKGAESEGGPPVAPVDERWILDHGPRNTIGNFLGSNLFKYQRSYHS